MEIKIQNRRTQLEQPVSKWGGRWGNVEGEVSLPCELRAHQQSWTWHVDTGSFLYKISFSFIGILIKRNCLKNFVDQDTGISTLKNHRRGWAPLLLTF